MTGASVPGAILKIVLLNVKYSSNLGDGVIAECIEHALRKRLPDAEIFSCDLAGRTDYGETAGLLRSVALTLLPVTPQFLKKAVYARLLESMVRYKLLPHYDRVINGADAAVIGGGQLLADDDLNFPMKIAAASAILCDRNIPVAVHAVGVGRDWSDLGTELFKESFVGARLVWASVRDRTSEERWSRHFGTLIQKDPQICLDPGLLAAQVYPAPATREGRNQPVIGLGVTHPRTLSAHFDGDRLSTRPGADFLRSSVDALCKDDHRVLLFTNGADDDEDFMRHTFPASYLKRYDEGQVRIAAPSRTPKDLVSTIRDCDVIASARLHACIVAFACGIPSVGLAMNKKLDAFFDASGQSDFLIRPDFVSAENVAAAIRSALQSPFDDERRLAMVRRAEAEFDGLADCLSTASERRAWRRSTKTIAPSSGLAAH